jgi:hypothetical protein
MLLVTHACRKHTSKLERHVVFASWARASARCCGSSNVWVRPNGSVTVCPLMERKGEISEPFSFRFGDDEADFGRRLFCQLQRQRLDARLDTRRLGNGLCADMGREDWRGQRTGDD